MKSKRASISNKLQQRDINALHNELGHPFEEITQATEKEMCLQLTHAFNLAKLVSLAKAKKPWVQKPAAPYSIVKVER